MRDLYALLLVAMTTEEARVELGFPRDGNPTPDEIKDAYRKNVKRTHPDMGGSSEDFIRATAAKDILEGKERPTYDRGSPSAPSSPGGYGGYSPRPRPEPRPDNVVTFDEAKNVAGIPADVDWLFVTERQRDKGGYSGDESASSKSAFVAYGQTGGKHVFAAAFNRYYEAFYVGGGPKMDVWVIKSLELPIKEGQKIEPAWLVGNIVKALKLVGFSGKFNFKVIPVKGKSWKFDDKVLLGSSMSVKHVMVDLGMVSGDDPSVAKRKQVVEMKVSRKYLSSGDDTYEVTLIINGKSFELPENEAARIAKLKLGGARLLNLIFGEYVYDSNPVKVLTRNRRGKIILQWLADNLSSLPDDAKAALQAASAQMK
jgi:hypothetical protein